MNLLAINLMLDSRAIYWGERAHETIFFNYDTYNIVNGDISLILLLKHREFEGSLRLA